MKNTESLISVKDKYNQLNIKANIIYKFVTTYNDYIKKPHDYGTGETINMAEVHILTLIEENPGITVTEVALEWNRTKGAISQTITKLENRGLIKRKKENNDAKSIHLYATEKGITLSQAHKTYDIKELTSTNEILSESFTLNQIDIFYKIMNQYTELLIKKD